MKVLIVVESYDGASNGNTISARRLQSGLLERGHEVRIAAAGDDREGKYGFGIFTLPIFGGLVKAQGFEFGRPDEKKMREAVLWADIVHVEMPFPLGKLAVRIARENNVPCTGAFHIQPENIWSSVNLGNCMPLVNFTYWFANKYIYRYFHYIHCPSRMIANMLAEHHYPAEKIVISNGISPKFFYHKCPKRKEFEGKFVIVMTARLSREKRQDVVIEAVRKSKHAKKIQLVLAGQGPLRDKYAEMGKDLPNPLIMDFLSQDGVIQLLGEADLYAHPTDIDIEPLSCMEAIASGLVPVISDSKRSGASQFALDDRSLFRAGDSSDMASKIDWWIEHDDERERMGHLYAEEALKYSLDKSIDQMIELFRDEMRRCGKEIAE